jgi:hypothetical protein
MKLPSIDVQIGAADTGGTGSHQDFAAPDLRVGSVAEVQGTIIGEDGGFHGLAVSLPQNGWSKGRAGAATSALERWRWLAETGKLPVMRYCSFPKIPGLPISALGFGCMRLPTADQCTECADCEPKCPQNIPIIEMLAKAHAHLT